MIISIRKKIFVVKIISNCKYYCFVRNNFPLALIIIVNTVIYQFKTGLLLFIVFLLPSGVCHLLKLGKDTLEARQSTSLRRALPLSHILL